MKNLAILLLIFIVFACKKDPLQTKTEYLTSGEWKITSYQIGNKNSIDTITKYFYDARFKLIQIEASSSERTDFMVESIDQSVCPISGYVMFETTDMASCYLKFYSHYILLQTKPEYIIPEGALPPIKHYYWHVDEISETKFTLSLNYNGTFLILNITR